MSDHSEAYSSQHQDEHVVHKNHSEKNYDLLSDVYDTLRSGKPFKVDHGEHADHKRDKLFSIRKATYKGHQIAIKTLYEIEIDGKSVRSGPFAEGSWEVSITDDLDVDDLNPFLAPVEKPLRGLERMLGTRGGYIPTRAEVRNIVHEGKLYDSEPWNESSVEGFRNNLEIPLHDYIHVWVFRDMVRATSPNDPVFFLHHANVDRIWAGWQQLHDNPPYLPGMNTSDDLLFHRINDYMFFVGTDPTTFELFDPAYKGRARPADVLDTSTRYKYDTFDDLLK
ncbi:MAG: tyrosinase family protein [Nitrososphaeraceae archaeon]